MIYNHLQTTIPNSPIWYFQNNFPQIWDVFQHFFLCFFKRDGCCESPFPSRRPPSTARKRKNGPPTLINWKAGLLFVVGIGWSFLSVGSNDPCCVFFLEENLFSIFLGKKHSRGWKKIVADWSCFFLTLLAYSTIVPRNIEKKRFHFLIICYVCSRNIEMTDECSSLFIWQIDCYDLNYWIKDVCLWSAIICHLFG